MPIIYIYSVCDNKPNGENKMTISELTVGTEIYYAGDMANIESTGKVIETGNIMGMDYLDVMLDNGRIMKRMSPVEFRSVYSGNGSTRFVTLAAYKKWREDKISEMLSRK